MLEQRGLTMWPWLVVPRWSRDLPCPPVICHLPPPMLSHHKIISTFVTQFNFQPQPPETKTSWYNLNLVTEIHSCLTKHGGTSFCFGGWYQISTADQIPDRDGKYMSIWRQIHYKEFWWRIEDDIPLIKQWAILNVFWMVWAEPRAAWTLDSVTAAEHQVTANLGSQANLNSILITLEFSFYLLLPENSHLY